MTISELKRIFCICDFNKEETDNLQTYLRGRMNQLKKIIPPEQKLPQ